MVPALLLVLSAWPADGASLQELPLPAVKASARKVRVFVDAGHGAPDNHGNTGCYGQQEEDHTRLAAKHLAFVLSALGPFEVALSRDEPGPKYAARIAAAKAFKADVIISLHSDARGLARPWWPYHDERMYWWNADAPGFSVLWSDEGTSATVAGRERLGRAVGARLREAGFLAYDGYDYSSLYRQDEVEPSGFIDIRPKKKRVYFLRASTIPTVIIETHHALDPEEVARWEETRTLDDFSLAVAAAVLDATRPSPAVSATTRAVPTTTGTR